MFEPRADGTGLRGYFFRSRGFGELFAVVTDDGGARSRRLPTENGPEFAWRQAMQETGPQVRVTESLPAHLNENRLARKPHICQASRRDTAFLVDLPGKQFRFETRLRRYTSLARGRIPNQKNDRQGRKARALGKLRGRRHAGLRFAKNQQDVFPHPYTRPTFGARRRLARGLGFLAIAQPPDNR